MSRTGLRRSSEGEQPRNLSNVVVTAFEKSGELPTLLEMLRETGNEPLPGLAPDKPTIASRPKHLFYVLNLQGIILLVDDWTCIALGYSREQLVGAPADRRLRPGEDAAVTEPGLLTAWTE